MCRVSLLAMAFAATLTAQQAHADDGWVFTEPKSDIGDYLGTVSLLSAAGEKLSVSCFDETHTMSLAWRAQDKTRELLNGYGMPTFLIGVTKDGKIASSPMKGSVTTFNDDVTATFSNNDAVVKLLNQISADTGSIFVGVVDPASQGTNRWTVLRQLEFKPGDNTVTLKTYLKTCG